MAEPTPKSRTFAVAVASKGSKGGILTVEIVAKADPKTGAASRVEVHAGPRENPGAQMLDVPVDVGADIVINSAETLDLNFDGHLDFWFVREMGAKWVQYEAFVFDPRTKKFVRDAFTREIGKLQNPTVDPVEHTIETRTIGPSMPSRAVRKVDKGRFTLVEECQFDNSQDTNGDDVNEGLLVIRKVVKGVMTTVVKKAVRVGRRDNPCAAGFTIPS